MNALVILDQRSGTYAGVTEYLGYVGFDKTEITTEDNMRVCSK
jgi:hypothetical protein